MYDEIISDSLRKAMTLRKGNYTRQKPGFSLVGHELASAKTRFLQ